LRFPCHIKVSTTYREGKRQKGKKGEKGEEGKGVKGKKEED
jgi:hypothetical protein